MLCLNIIRDLFLSIEESLSLRGGELVIVGVDEWCRGYRGFLINSIDRWIIL